MARGAYVAPSCLKGFVTTATPTLRDLGTDLLRFHSFELTLPPNDHLEDLPAGEALEWVGQEDGEGEKDAADVHLRSSFASLTT